MLVLQNYYFVRFFKLLKDLVCNRLGRDNMHMKVSDEGADVGEVAFREHTLFETLGLGLSVGEFPAQLT